MTPIDQWFYNPDMKKLKKPSMREIAEAADCHIDTIFRIRSGRNHPSWKLAKKLEEVLGIDRRRFLHPDEFGDPWEVFEEKYR